MQNDSYSVHVHRMFYRFRNSCSHFRWIYRMRPSSYTPHANPMGHRQVPEPKSYPGSRDSQKPVKLDEITWALSPRQLRDRHELYVRWAHRIYLNIAIRPDTLKKPALDDAYSEAVRVDILRAYTALNRYEYALDAKSSQPQKLRQASTDALGYSRGVIRQTGLILGDWKEPRNISAKSLKGKKLRYKNFAASVMKPNSIFPPHYRSIRTVFFPNRLLVRYLPPQHRF